MQVESDFNNCLQKLHVTVAICKSYFELNAGDTHLGQCCAEMGGVGGEICCAQQPGTNFLC